jgi:hypothetical protein
VRRDSWVMLINRLTCIRWYWWICERKVLIRRHKKKYQPYRTRYVLRIVRLKNIWRNWKYWIQLRLNKIKILKYMRMMKWRDVWSNWKAKLWLFGSSLKLIKRQTWKENKCIRNNMLINFSWKSYWESKLNNIIQARNLVRRRS